MSNQPGVLDGAPAAAPPTTRCSPCRRSTCGGARGPRSGRVRGAPGWRRTARRRRHRRVVLEPAMVDDVVAVQAARHGGEVRRAVDVGDAEVGQVGHDRGGVVEPEGRLELEPSRSATMGRTRSLAVRPGRCRPHPSPSWRRRRPVSSPCRACAPRRSARRGHRRRTARRSDRCPTVPGRPNR